MKCTAIELSEELLEETSEQHRDIYEMISRDADETQLKKITEELARHSVMQLAAYHIYIYIILVIVLTNINYVTLFGLYHLVRHAS